MIDRRPDGRRARMEDDGPAGARSRDDGAARSGPSSACSTRTAGRWASVKAVFWLVVIIMILGYIPDRAYYFTVGAHGRPRRPRLVADQPLPARERDPAVPGAGRRDRAVAAVAARARRCPPPRTDGVVVQIGTRLLYIGGTDGTTAQADGLRRARRSGPATSTSGRAGPPLPAPRTDAGVAFVAGQHLRHRRQGRRRRPDRPRSSS